MSFDAKSLTDAELESARDKLQEELADIRHQIDLAKARAAAEGVYSDHDWLHKAKHALRWKGLHHQQALQELARRRREKKQNAHMDRMFVKAAEKLLDPDMIEEIRREAGLT